MIVDCQLERVFAEDSKQRERREALIKNYEDHPYQLPLVTDAK